MAGYKAAIARVIISDIAGPAAGAAIAVAIMASVFGALNGNILARPRIAYAMAQDGLSFGFLGRAHRRWATPHWAIVIQSAVGIILVLSLRDFDKLTTYFVVAEWFSLIFAIAAVFVLRRRLPNVVRPYRTPGYPWAPLLFVIGTSLGLGAIVWGELQERNWSPVWGLLIVLAGFPIYYLWRAAETRAKPLATAPREGGRPT
jgi:APA family basic amino acid/polyamine antiporter